MNTELFIDKLKHCREILTSLKNSYSLSNSAIEKRKMSNKDIDSRLKEFLLLQKGNYKYFVGGEEVECNRVLIDEMNYDSILQTRQLSTGDEKDRLRNFIDADPCDFQIINEVLSHLYRVALEKKDNLLNTKIISLFLPKNLTSQKFMELLQIYFPNSFMEICFDIGIQYFSLSKKKYVIFECGSQLFSPKFTLSNQLEIKDIEKYMITSTTELNNGALRKALFVAVYTELVLTLKESKTVDTIVMQPFYDGFQNNEWDPNQGGGSYIFGSMDNKEWDMISVVPDGYGAVLGEKFTFPMYERRTIKYIKFETGPFSLSIAFLHLY